MTFIDFARSQGLNIDPNKFYASDRINRCGTIENPKSKNGAYFWDGERGWAFNWQGEARTVWYSDPNAKPWTKEEKALWSAKRSEMASDQERKYEQTAMKASITIRSAKLDKHPYLESKGFFGEKGLVLGDKLLIPMRNVLTNKLQGYQEIYYDFESSKYVKKMLGGMRAKNAVYWIGGQSDKEVWLVEGYVTGLSVAHALKTCGIKASVLVCFSASNLICVADQVKGKRFVYADNDSSQTGQKAAEAVKLPYCMSDTIGNDANDDEVKEGIFYVMQKIMDCRNTFSKICV
jgi:putative DNA primase/helicase